MSSLKDELRQKGVKGLFAGDTDNTLIQFFRYIFVGGLCLCGGCRRHDPPCRAGSF